MLPIHAFALPGLFCRQRAARAIMTGWGRSMRRTRYGVAIAIGMGLVMALLPNPAEAQAAGAGQADAKIELRAAPVVAIAAQVKNDETSATLTFVLSRPIEAKAFALDNPDRIVIDLPDVNFQIEGTPGRAGSGLIEAFRYGAIVTGRSRIVIDLRQPARVSRIDSRMRPTGEAATLTIDLQRVTRADFAAAVSRRPAAAPVPPPPVVTPGDMRSVVVIDAGHGGVDPGAIGARGAMEKTLVLAFAQRLRDRLEQSGRVRVVMTRDSDVFISLGERVRMARAAQGDLFVSIHADTLSASPEVRGATIYTGAERASDAESALLADKENRVDTLAGIDDPEILEGVAGILADLTVRETRSFSNHAAQQVIADLGTAMRLNKNPHRSAGFRVLKAPDVPSILIELGYLSSAEDVALMQTADWRDRTTGAVARAILRFLAQRQTVSGAAEGAASRASVSP